MACSGLSISSGRSSMNPGSDRVLSDVADAVRSCLVVNLRCPIVDIGGMLVAIGRG